MDLKDLETKVKPYRIIQEVITFSPKDYHVLEKLQTRDINCGKIKQYKINGNWFYREDFTFSRTILCRTSDIMEKGIELLSDL